MGDNGLDLNKFTLMNSVIEFMPTNTTSSTSTPSNQSMYVMGDFALLESEMNPGRMDCNWYTQPHDFRIAKDNIHALGDTR